MSHPAKGVSFATALSIVLHGMFAAVVMSLPDTWLEEVAIVDAPIEIEIVDDRVDAMESEAEVEPEPEPEAAEPEAPPDPLEPQPAALIQDNLPPPLPTESGEPSEVDENPVASGSGPIDSPTVAPDPGAPLDSARMRALLAPGAVARGGFVLDAPGPSRTGPPAGNARGGPRALSEAEAEARHNDHLRERAMSKAHTQREPFVIRRQRDGSYRHDGHLFVGIIQPDGEVVFQEHGAVQTDGFSASGSWDMTSLLMGASGQNPRQAEEDRFMRETEELRHRLEREHRAQELAASSRALRGRLRRVWGTETRSHAARRARLFHIWDELAEDGSADSLRRGVLRFIRGNLPEGDEHAYSADELARLNARRDSRAEFAPY